MQIARCERRRCAFWCELLSSNSHEVSLSLKACENAMIQCRKSRVQPQSHAIKQSKTLLSNNTNASNNEYNEQVILPTHPSLYDGNDDTNNDASMPKSNNDNSKFDDNKTTKAKTSAQTAKEREIEQKNKMKHMPKADRKRLIENKKKNERLKEEKEFDRNRSKKRRDVAQRQGKLIRRL